MIQDEQIRTLVQQLFFRGDGPQLRHVGFTAADLEADIAPLCKNVAKVLSEEGNHDVALIDASPGCVSLHSRLGQPALTGIAACQIETRLWLVPRQSWMEDQAAQLVSDKSLFRLHGLTAQFDFTILCCAPMSWTAVQVGRIVDGLVLVLAANKTRRLVVTKMQEQLRSARVPLLGTVLTERRFPVPPGLYRNL
jgi:hypothetical protein